MMTEQPDADSLSLVALSGHQQDWLLWAAVIGAVASMAGVLLLAITPDAFVIDYALQLALAVVLGACAARILFMPQADVTPVATFVSVFTTAAFAARFGSALVFAHSTAELEVMLLPYSGWWPLIVLINAAFMPRSTALRLSGAYCAALAAGLCLYAATHLRAFLDSFQLICLGVFLVCGLPLMLLMVSGIVRMYHDLLRTHRDMLRAHQDLLDGAAGAPSGSWISERELEGLASRRLQERDTSAPATLVIISLKPGTMTITPCTLLACITPPRDALAQLDEYKAAWLSGLAISELGALLDRIEERARQLRQVVSIGAAPYREGETARAWIERAKFAAFAARDLPDRQILIDS